MSDILTDAEIAAAEALARRAKALAEAATPEWFVPNGNPEWVCAHDEGVAPLDIARFCSLEPHLDVRRNAATLANAAFAAAARSDVPDLADYVLRMADEIRVITRILGDKMAESELMAEAYKRGFAAGHRQGLIDFWETPINELPEDVRSKLPSGTVGLVALKME